TGRTACDVSMNRRSPSQLDWLLKAGLSPHMAVASHMPASFVKYGEAEAWGDRRLDPKGSTSPKSIDHYNAYAKALVRYIADKMFAGGAQTAIFEVSNEIDIAADYPTCSGSTCTLQPLVPWGRWLWWIDPSTYNPAGNAQVYTIAHENDSGL